MNDAGWSSLVARRAHNPKVVSSNLTPATNLRNTKHKGLLAPEQPFFFASKCDCSQFCSNQREIEATFFS